MSTQIGLKITLPLAALGYLVVQMQDHSVGGYWNTAPSKKDLISKFADACNRFCPHSQG